LSVRFSPTYRTKTWGNFTVWPGTPNLFADYYNERTDEQLQQEAEARVLKTGIPPIELPEPVQITASAGDLILVHYGVAHAVAPNVSPYVRYALFYRFGWNVNRNSPYEVMRQPWPALEYLKSCGASVKAMCKSSRFGEYSKI
jgi:hypothetical protein